MNDLKARYEKIFNIRVSLVDRDAVAATKKTIDPIIDEALAEIARLENYEDAITSARMELGLYDGPFICEAIRQIISKLKQKDAEIERLTCAEEKYVDSLIELNTRIAELGSALEVYSCAGHYKPQGRSIEWIKLDGGKTARQALGKEGEKEIVIVNAFHSQCNCGHIIQEQYKFKKPTENGVIGFSWCGFCRTRFNVIPIPPTDANDAKGGDDGMEI